MQAAVKNHGCCRFDLVTGGDLVWCRSAMRSGVHGQLLVEISQRLLAGPTEPAELVARGPLLSPPLRWVVQGTRKLEAGRSDIDRPSRERMPGIKDRRQQRARLGPSPGRQPRPPEDRLAAHIAIGNVVHRENSTSAVHRLPAA